MYSYNAPFVKSVIENWLTFYWNENEAVVPIALRANICSRLRVEFYNLLHILNKRLEKQKYFQTTDLTNNISSI